VNSSSTVTITGGDGLSATVAVHSDIDAVGTLTTKLENILTTGEDEVSQQIHQPAHKEETTTEDVTEVASVSTTVTTRHRRQNHHQLLHKRVCTVCFKQPALPDDDDTATTMTDDGMGDHELDHRNRPLKLRQVKALQRQREKQQQQQDEKKPKKKAPITDTNEEEAGEEEDSDESDDDDEDKDNDEQYDDDDDDDTYNYGSCSEMAAPDTLNHIRSLTTSGRTNGMLDMTNDDDINDPFLQAIGGAQNLLVGEAYQKKLLEKNTKPSVYE
jgi:hypothetical protein